MTRTSDIELTSDNRPKKVLDSFGNSNNVIVISNHINAGGAEGAEQLLRDTYKDGLTLKQAEDLALVTLRQVIQEKLNENNIEVACANVAKGCFEIYNDEQRQEIVARLPKDILPTE